MIVAVEGPDLAGKSTLCRASSRVLGVPSFAPWASFDFARPSLTSISRTLLGLERSTRMPFIVDRFIVSELCYGPIAGRPSEYVWGLLEEWRGQNSLAVLLLLPPEHVIRERYAARGDAENSLDTVLRCLDAYRSIVERLATMFPVVTAAVGSVAMVSGLLASSDHSGESS